MNVTKYQNSLSTGTKVIVRKPTCLQTLRRRRRRRRHRRRRRQHHTIIRPQKFGGRIKSSQMLHVKTIFMQIKMIYACKLTKFDRYWEGMTSFRSNLCSNLLF